MTISEGDFRLDGKVAVIAGGSRGIGEAIARTCAKVGAKVVIASRYLENLESVAQSVRAEGGEMTPIVCHIGRLDQIRNLAAQTVATYGSIDILVNNAGTNPFFGPMVEAEEWAWEKTVGVNLKGYFFLSQEAARVMIRNGGGKIINVASMGGFRAAPMQGIYAITKAGVISMTRGLAHERAEHNIRVNAIAPGLINTKMAEHLINTKEILDRALARTPLRRYGEPEEMAGAALFLASDASSFMTGATMMIDGGSIL
jgi:NAD(P)-dependent dehydrogenase (short-subunit alcohol dehydrogenase family)